ncbi:MAG: ATP-dependent DNA helicase RecG [bacterium]|nr:ATP-dependent DNA helicase RecG [bacterium]
MLDKPVLHWESSLEYAPGVGPARWQTLSELGITTVGDALSRCPKRYIDRSKVYAVAELATHDKEDVTCIGEVQSFGEIFAKRMRKRIYKVIFQDATGGAFEVMYYDGLSYHRDQFKEGDWFAVSGKVSLSPGRPNFSHPSLEKLEDEETREAYRASGRIVPVYPLSESMLRTGLRSRTYQRVIEKLLERCELSETLPEEVRTRCGLPDRKTSFQYLHLPENIAQTEVGAAFQIAEELFFFQWAVLLKRAEQKQLPAPALSDVGNRTHELLKKFPFELTKGQRNVLNEIYKDMRQPRPMLRLLQGDVGSGKTVIALLALMMAVEAGWQGALMAPTEILAEQHYLTSVERFEQLGVRVGLLVSGMPIARQREVLGGIQSGDIQVAIGTHALIQERVKFKRLGLVIIDEQHRFGVRQRGLLSEKGEAVHTLVMTATPIPRTLALTAYGDLDVSRLDEKPAARGAIKMIGVTPAKREDVYRAVRSNAEAGLQSYVVFPLVEESEKLDLKAATEEYETLSKGILAGIPVGLLHGRMSLEEKNQALHRFANGVTKILIATTVIEVGVDVPTATMLVVEHAERFGLAQLHQLRGRIGRGSYPSQCILIVYQHSSAVVKDRIAAIKRTNDGFELAEVDLTLRGSGEYFGTRQHGLPELKWADLVRDRDWVIRMRGEAEITMGHHPNRENDPVWEEFYRRFGDRMNLGTVA